MQEEKCGHGEKHKPMRDVVQRACILLYDIEFTPLRHINGVSKLALARALESHEDLCCRLPKSGAWVPNKAATKKVVSRQR